MKGEKAKKEKLVDINQLLTVTNFSKLVKEKRQNVYYQISANHLKHDKIDGVPFVHKKEVKKFKKKI